MYKNLYEIIASMKGSVLAIGLDEKLATKIDKNDNILKCDILNYESKKDIDSNGKKKKEKRINIKKLRKIYKKKKIDYILCNYEHISKYLNTFIKDSIYINKIKLYFYGVVDEELIVKRYKRYNTKIEIKKFKDSIIIEIDTTNAKNNILKEFKYKLIDGFIKGIELIGDILMG